MTRDQLELHREKLLQMKNSILNRGVLNISDDLFVSQDDLPDETDLASNIINQQVSFSIRNRELRKLRLIEMALQRIEDGTYGICDDCDDEIENPRLNNQPWTNLCIIHAEERERHGTFAHGLRQL
ncbi:TraR/DksA family transcriptional regulator [Bacteriovoracaceae bacterium]|nr:TraR/DksA family transcriptional regulator [Bacteriovoracaceae bacterium]